MLQTQTKMQLAGFDAIAKKKKVTKPKKVVGRDHFWYKRAENFQHVPLQRHTHRHTKPKACRALTRNPMGQELLDVLRKTTGRVCLGIKSLSARAAAHTACALLHPRCAHALLGTSAFPKQGLKSRPALHWRKSPKH